MAESDEENSSDDDNTNNAHDGSVSDSDLVMNVIDGSDDEDEFDDEDNIVFVPSLRNVTGNGRYKGGWGKNFNLPSDTGEDSEEDSGEDSEEDSGEDGEEDSGEDGEDISTKTYVTRSGRVAGTWKLSRKMNL